MVILQSKSSYNIIMFPKHLVDSNLKFEEEFMAELENRHMKSIPSSGVALQPLYRFLPLQNLSAGFHNIDEKQNVFMSTYFDMYIWLFGLANRLLR